MNVRRCLRPTGAPLGALFGALPRVMPRALRGALTGALFVAAALLPGCAANVPASFTAMPPAPSRPRDPWVVRCVLDKQPRMLVIALDTDLWAAYDTETCTLSKTWRGDVNFDGPVYTTMHGPQPTSRGDLLPDPLAGSEWICPVTDEYSKGFWARDDHKAPVRFLGHRFVDGHVQLACELTATDGTKVIVHETLEVDHLEPGRIDLLRKFDFDRTSDVWKPQLVVRGGQDRSGLPLLAPAFIGGSFTAFEDGHAQAGTVAYALRFDDPTLAIRVSHEVDSSRPPGTQSPAAPATPAAPVNAAGTTATP